MAATHDKTPLGHESDSDEAPEVVTKQSAEQQALTLRRHEDAARAQAKAQATSKQEPKPQDEVPELPDDVLSAVAAHHEEEQQQQQEQQQQETAAQRRAKKRKQAKVAELLRRKTHTRQFGNIEVQTLDAVEDAQTRELSDSAKQFLERRTAPHRPRMNVLEGHASQFTKKQKQRSQRS
ncbi:unnamed protein product [Phytophthora fragariaefolia]|uniref:Unnamed protein product n=1 Tax=Phytophthora fragariaefolia TaxID=1490495 RepID=A0A9W6X1K0_9STRA|nr:unnamed protein product [Phytophthora fragariaefolia]